MKPTSLKTNPHQHYSKILLVLTSDEAIEKGIIAETLQRYSSNRDKQKGEFYVHGFTLAMTCLQNFYLPISEQDAGVKSLRGQEVSGGYADIYMQPRLDNYPELAHSYLLELKYLPSSSTDAEVETARQNAIAQLTRYAQGINIAGTKGHTQLHRLILVWRGMELAVAEEFLSETSFSFYPRIPSGFRGLKQNHTPRT